MSIKKSLRMYIILLASIPVIIMTLLAYMLASNKYLELTKSSISENTSTYTNGFLVSLRSMAKDNELIASNMYVQSCLAEKANDPGFDLSTSVYYNAVKQQIETITADEEHPITYALYDIDGYYVTGTTLNKGDWSEYMSTPVSSIEKTTFFSDAAISDTEDSLEIVTPVIVKQRIIGLLRMNVDIGHFGTFLSNDKPAYVMDAEGNFLFHHDGLLDDPYIENQLSTIRTTHTGHEPAGTNTYLCYENNHSTYIYGYTLIPELDWIYILRENRNAYYAIISSLPLLLIAGLLVILLIALAVSTCLAKKYTDPIVELNTCMLEASSGNYQVYCDIKRKDEFGQLSSCFNEMMQIIADTNERQLETQRQLEANEVQLIEHNKHIEELAYTDGLTKLNNRLAFMKLCQDILGEARSSYKKHAVLFIDLDDFKNVNDTLGHDYGDELLIQLADQLTTCIQPGDILARTGGDEFLIFRNHIDSFEDAEQTARELVDITKHPFKIMDETVHVSMSVGVSFFPQDGLTLNELIKNADIAMYNAKTNGKNNYQTFNSSMADEINKKSEIIAILQEAMAKEEMYMVYQPQADVVTGKIIGYEALMRLNSSIAGFVPPSEFIPVAEECGIIDALGDWALFEACAFNKRLINEGFKPITVSVNVSTAQLSGNHIITTLERVQDETGMPLEYLEIEITESILMDDLEHNLNLISKMKEMGAKIALDDFGTGYSSFNYLTQIPINTLKIDKAFIDGICNNEKDRYIADTIISLAHKMDIRVIAEGVEDINQLRILQTQMCDVIQGYYFSKPIEEDAFITLLQSNS